MTPDEKWLLFPIVAEKVIHSEGGNEPREHTQRQRVMRAVGVVGEFFEKRMTRGETRAGCG